MAEGTAQKKMPKREPRLQRTMHLELERLMATQRVMILGQDQVAIRPGDPAAIVSSVAGIRILNDTAAYSGRRQRLQFGNSDAGPTLLARTRPLPPGLVERRCLVQTALNRQGQPVPVSCLDLESHTLHLLVDLAGAEPGRAAPEAGVARLVIRRIYGEPITAMANGAGTTWVGPRVSLLVRTAMDSGRSKQRRLLQQEMAVLQELGVNTSMPTALARRLGSLKQWISQAENEEAAEPVKQEQAEQEVSRLTRLVKSRACAYIRLSSDEITGLVNPRILGRSAALPILFQLSLKSGARAPLRLWNPLHSTRRGGVPCLGEGLEMLDEQQKARDLYGMVDTVLNYLETTGTGLFRLNGGRPDRRWMDGLMNMF